MKINGSIFPWLLGLFFLCFGAKSIAQPIKNVVFEGAGIRGIAYCGAVDVLEKEGLLNDVEKLGGTSSGALTALCLSLGYTSAEMRDILYHTPYKKLNDGFKPTGIFRLKKFFGWYKGQKLTNWIAEIIKQKVGNADITFAELSTMGCKDLYIIAACINLQKKMIFSQHSFPHMRVRDAVRASMSIPFYYEPVYIDTSGKSYLRPKNKTDLMTLVDGMLLDNFPIAIFDSTSVKDGKEQRLSNPNTIGFKLEDSLQKIQYEKDGGLRQMSTKNMKSFSIAVFKLVSETLTMRNTIPSDLKRTIMIEDGNISPRIGKMKDWQIDILLRKGNEATETFLKTRQNTSNATK